MTVSASFARMCVSAACAMIAASLPAQLPHPLNPDQLTQVPGLGVHINGIRPNVNNTNALQTGAAIHGAGDFNGDGLADLIIGAPGHDPPTGNDRGEAILVMGTASLGRGGLFELVDLDGTNGTRFQGFESQLLGGSLSGVGDVNGDGLHDSLLGFFPVSASPAGSAYLLYGSSTLPGSNGVFNLAELDGRIGVRIAADAMGLTFFGRTVRGVGDINGDGLSDIAMASFDDTILLLYGRKGGLGIGGRLDIMSLDGTHGIIVTGALGSGMSGAGDVNGDGVDDLLISQTNETPRRSYLIAGSTAGLGASGELDLPSAVGNGVLRLDASPASGLGTDVAGIGDLNGDGLDDMVLGDPGPSGDLGRLFVVLGDDALFDSESLDLETLAPSQGFILTGVDPDDRIGIRVAGGDINGDGFSDLLATVEGASECHVIYGRPDGVAPELITSLSNLDGANGVRVDNTPPFQEITSVGDHNGDGVSDFLISWDTGTGSALPLEFPTGECYLFYGRTNSLSATYRTHIRTGDAPRKAIGALSDGSHPIPPSRCWLDHDGGSGPGNAGASLETVTLTRSGASVENLADAADVMWTVTTDRSGHTETQVTVKYISAEVTGLDEFDLRLFHASSPAGPWELALPMALNVRRNEVTGTVTTLGASPEHFAIAASGGALGITNQGILEHLLGITTDPTHLDVNGDWRVDIADLAFNLNALEP